MIRLIHPLRVPLGQVSRPLVLKTHFSGRFFSSAWPKLQNEDLNSKELDTLKDKQKQKQLALQKDEQIKQAIIQQQVNRHIPGRAPQTNDWKDRVPKFPFTKENVPTLIPRQDVPKPGSNLYKMVQFLETKKEPELIYEAESHRLYFVFCSAFALVAIIYGLTFLESATNSAWKMYKKNEDKLTDMQNLVMFITRNCISLAVFALPMFIALVGIYMPTKLVRRMWYIPKNCEGQGNGNKELIRFTTHPLLPNRPTPVHTLELSQINRSVKSKIFTNKGFYLTIDNGSFFFLLKETGNRIPWIVDRKGFFWGDGRLFDYLFGKESVSEADSGISYDDKVGAVNKMYKENVKKMKKEYGVGWQVKAHGELVKEDLQKLAAKLKKKKAKELPKGDEK